MTKHCFALNDKPIPFYIQGERRAKIEKKRAERAAAAKSTSLVMAEQLAAEEFLSAFKPVNACGDCEE